MTITWDNVGKKVHSEDLDANQKMFFMNWSLAYMSINRIPVTHMNVNDRIPAADIVFETFIPDTANFFMFE